MPRSWRILLIIACLGVLLLLLWRSPPKQLGDLLAGDKQTPIFPTSYMSNARTSQYNELGKISHTLTAAQIRFYEPRTPSEPEAIFDQPSLTLFAEDTEDSPWLVSADSAEGNNKGDELHMIDNVVIRQQLLDGSERVFTTSALLVQPVRRYAETDKAVIIKDQTGITHATGVKLFFDKKRIELLSEVEGNYAAQ